MANDVYAHHTFCGKDIEIFKSDLNKLAEENNYDSLESFFSSDDYYDVLAEFYSIDDEQGRWYIEDIECKKDFLTFTTWNAWEPICDEFFNCIYYYYSDKDLDVDLSMWAVDEDCLTNSCSTCENITIMAVYHYEDEYGENKNYEIGNNIPELIDAIESNFYKEDQEYDCYFYVMPDEVECFTDEPQCTDKDGNPISLPDWA